MKPAIDRFDLMLAVLAVIAANDMPAAHDAPRWFVVPVFIVSLSVIAFRWSRS